MQRIHTETWVCPAGRGRYAALVLLGITLLGVPLAPGQPGNLNFFKNYFVTGDYTVGGVGLRGLGVNDPVSAAIAGTSQTNKMYATGSVSVANIPAGADIVAAFLYWQSVEKSQSAFAGQRGVFNGYGIQGTILGNPNSPVSWSAGGCAGSSQGTTTLRTYRADVRPYLAMNLRGSAQGSGPYPVSLADSGSNGGGTPLTLGATLVVVYRALGQNLPLEAVSLYDGSFAPGNTAQTMSQTLHGFYEASVTPFAKLTHVVGNGQPNKIETLYFNNVPISASPFPGTLNGSWDNPTFIVSQLVPPEDDDAKLPPLTTQVIPAASNSGCVSWGAVIFATTVQDQDNDGLLDSWEDNQGYTDVQTGQWVPLPGASKTNKDLFVEVDYLNNLDGGASAFKHSHLPKQAALDKAGAALSSVGVNVHFDVGNVYKGDQYVIANGSGGNSIPESATVCNDVAGAPLCEFPGQAVAGWKGGYLFIKNNATLPGTNIPLGNFNQARRDSYHYMLFGHALGVPRSFWSAFASTEQSNAVNKLMSVVDVGNTATVTLQSPPLVLKPGDPVVAGDPAFGDSNLDRVTITGAIRQIGLNGTYKFSNLTTSTTVINNLAITTNRFTITTSNVADGTYNFGNEPQLGVAYAGATGRSGQSDLGGGDSAEMFGLWPADDTTGCNADPSLGPPYCDNQVGSVQAQAGTLLHELGHTLALTHGGTFYQNSTVPSYGQNCNPAFLSVMNYLFQIRGFPDGMLAYSSLALPGLDETNLSESVGIGPVLHGTRFYAPPNPLDLKLGARLAPRHCDGTPLGPNEPGEVRVDSSPLSSQVDWNNDGVVPDAVTSPIDIDHNGLIDSRVPPSSPLLGFSDQSALDLRQIGARSNKLRASGAAGLDAFDLGGGLDALDLGGGLDAFDLGGGLDASEIGGGLDAADIGGGLDALDLGGGLDAADIGGGSEQDFDTANSSVDAASGLSAVQSGHNVALNWTKPAFGQIRTYFIYRLLGSFDPVTNPLSNAVQVGKVSSQGPPATSFADTTVKNKTTYTYFIISALAKGAQSAPSNLAQVSVSF